MNMASHFMEGKKNDIMNTLLADDQTIFIVSDWSVDSKWFSRKLWNKVFCLLPIHCLMQTIQQWRWDILYSALSIHVSFKVIPLCVEPHPCQHVTQRGEWQKMWERQDCYFIWCTLDCKGFIPTIRLHNVDAVKSTSKLFSWGSDVT